MPIFKPFLSSESEQQQMGRSLTENVARHLMEKRHFKKAGGPQRHLAAARAVNKRNRRRSSSLSRIQELKKKAKPLKVTPAIVVDEWDKVMSRKSVKGASLPRHLRSKSRYYSRFDSRVQGYRCYCVSPDRCLKCYRAGFIFVRTSFV